MFAMKVNCCPSPACKTGRAVSLRVSLLFVCLQDISALREPDLKIMLISVSDECWCVTTSSRCSWLVSLCHVLQVDIDLPENKRTDFQPNRNPFASVQRDTFCLTSEMFFPRYYTHSGFPISHSRMKFSASEMLAGGTMGKCVIGWTRHGHRAGLQSLLYCLRVLELQKTQPPDCMCALWI